MTFEQLQMLVLAWASNNKILHEGDSKTQFIKLVEEVGELGKGINHRNKPEIIDGIGDVLVTLISLCWLTEADPVMCLEAAYNEIKDRRGQMFNGTFIKEKP
jgi:NTP pyrophosphatase (non-canonical NTP hydrolase)